MLEKRSKYDSSPRSHVRVSTESEQTCPADEKLRQQGHKSTRWGTLWDIDFWKGPKNPLPLEYVVAGSPASWRRRTCFIKPLTTQGRQFSVLALELVQTAGKHPATARRCSTNRPLDSWHTKLSLPLNSGLSGRSFLTVQIPAADIQMCIIVWIICNNKGHMIL